MGVGMDLAIWCAAVLAVVALNLMSGRHPDATGMSFVLLLIWVMSNVLYGLYTPPESMKLFPLMDLAGGLTVIVAWWQRRAVWKLCLAALFLFMCITHGAFWFQQWADPGSNDLRFYVTVLNVLFGLQLVCVATPGVSDVGAAFVRRWMRRHPRPVPIAGPSG